MSSAPESSLHLVSDAFIIRKEVVKRERRRLVVIKECLSQHRVEDTSKLSSHCREGTGLPLPAGPRGGLKSLSEQSLPPFHAALGVLSSSQSRTVLPPCDPILPPLLPTRAPSTGQQGWLALGTAAGILHVSLPRAPGPCKVTMALRGVLDSSEGPRERAAHEGHPHLCFCVVTLLSLQVVCLFSPFDLRDNHMALASPQHCSPGRSG